MRRLTSLIMGLPPSSALHRSVDPAGSSWGNTEELLASLIEITDYGNRLFYTANTKSGTSTPKPVRVVRPWGERASEPEPSKPKARSQASPEEFSRFVGRHMKLVPKES